MTTCILVTLLLWVLFARDQALGQALSDDPRFTNVFEGDPVPKYYWMWWRPYKVVLDRGKCLAIERQLQAIDEEELERADLAAAFGANVRSAFLFPVLAAQGEKGTKILLRFLQEYARGRDFDEQWLLVVASVGRIGTVHAKDILENEMTRVSKEYELAKPYFISGVRVPRADGRIAVVDALLAWEAAHQTLSAAKIESYCSRIPELTWLTWTIGLEWAQQRMPEASVLTILRDGLGARDRDDLIKDMSRQKVSEHLRAIREFMIRRESWPITRKLVLAESGQSSSLSEYLTVFYSRVLVAKADYGAGKYPIDEDEVKMFTSARVGEAGLLARSSRILMSCKPSKTYEEWDDFLAKHSACLDPKDKDFVRYFIERVHGPKTEETRNLYETPNVFENIKAPGVYIRGFVGIRGQK